MDLQAFFSPKAIAVIGASADPDKVGHAVFKNLLDYPGGTVYGINPKAIEILGRQTFPDLDSLPEVPDLAVVCIPARLIPELMRALGDKKVRAAVIISAGFKEIGEEGRRLERKVASIARAGRVELIGPNVLGILNARNGLNASFAGELPLAGDIAMISQSGALCTGMLDWASSNHIGFSKVISMGNKADLDENDFLEAFADDDETRVITGYLENINEGTRFIRTATKVGHHKPVILLKAGNTAAGAAAASSHTGSLAGAEAAYDCAFRIAGIIRARTIEDLFDLAQGLAYQPLPRGTRVAVITNAGGAGILAADAIEGQGMKLAGLADDTKDALRAFLSPAASVNNPVDILGDAGEDKYRQALDAVAADPGVDALLVLTAPQAMTRPAAIAREVVAASEALDKPVMASFFGAAAIREAVEILQTHDIPHYPSPERAVEVLVAMRRYREWLEAPARTIPRLPVNSNKVKKILKNYRRQGLPRITEQDAKSIFEAYGLNIPEGSMATTREAAVAAARKLGYPVVMKVVSQDVVHKSDVGGVRVGLKDSREVEDAFDLMMLRIPNLVPGARIEGVLVEEMKRGGREVILGMTRDPQFGPMLMFGLGGIYVEVLKDVTFHLAPLTVEEALEMLSATKTFALLKGVRGEQGVDLRSIAEALQRIAQLVVDFPEIQELDINPLRVGTTRGETVALDARITLVTEEG
jgi:acetyl coenzyme A synthetase (ADP forming)-like protein